MDARALASIARGTCVALLVLGACSSAPPTSATEVCAHPDPKTCVLPTFAVTSPAFADGGRMPADYTCDGADASPPISWAAPPPATVSIEIRMTDVDANLLRHWKMTGVKSSVRGIGRGEVPAGALVGSNSFGTASYKGPCPPTGDVYHRYFFEVRALDSSGVPIAVGRVVGTYARK